MLRGVAVKLVVVESESPQYEAQKCQTNQWVPGQIKKRLTSLVSLTCGRPLIIVSGNNRKRKQLEAISFP